MSSSVIVKFSVILKNLQMLAVVRFEDYHLKEIYYSL